MLNSSSSSEIFQQLEFIDAWKGLIGIWSCKTCMKLSSSESMLVFQETQVAWEPADLVRIRKTKAKPHCKNKSMS